MILSLLSIEEISVAVFLLGRKLLIMCQDFFGLPLANLNFSWKYVLFKDVASLVHSFLKDFAFVQSKFILVFLAILN